MSKLWEADVDRVATQVCDSGHARMTARLATVRSRNGVHSILPLKRFAPT